MYVKCGGFSAATNGEVVLQLVVKARVGIRGRANNRLWLLLAEVGELCNLRYKGEGEQRLTVW